MNELKVFDYEGLKIRTVIKDGEPWWVLKDVCAVLEIGNSRMVFDRLDEDEKGVSQIDTLGGKQNMQIISESGLYNVVLRSDKPQAKPFRKWVTSEVLPSIRKTGGYIPANGAESDTEIMARAVLIAQKTIEMQNAQIEEMKPKAEFYDAVTDSKTAITVGEVAKVLDCGMGRNKLFEFLRNKGILMHNNIPYQIYVDRGYFRIIESKSVKHDGGIVINLKTLVLQKGVDCIRKILKEADTE